MRTTKTVTHEMIMKHDVIIYGAGVCGEIVYRGLESIGKVPLFFCDSNEKKDVLWNVPIIMPQELTEYKNAVVLLASFNYFYEMKKECELLGVENYYDIEYILNLAIPEERLSYQAQDVYANKGRYLDIINHSPEENRLCIGKIEITVSEICSLKCKDCSYLMPHYKKPRNIPIEDCMYYIDRLLEYVDRISELRLLGGEPLMHPELWKLINKYVQEEKIGIIDVHTNGTIIPSESVLQSFQNEKVIVHISDYNVANNKIDQLIELFKENNIKFFARKYDKWLQFGDMEDKHYSLDRLQEAFWRCTARNCLTLKGSRLYHCPRSAHATTIGLIPDFNEDYIDLENWDEVDQAIIKERIREYTMDPKPIRACNFCVGGLVSREVDAAEQL